MPSLDLRVLVLERLQQGLPTISPFAATLLDDPDAAAMRSTLGVPSYAEATALLTATGYGGTAPTITALITQVGKLVTLEIPIVSGTSNAETMTLTGLPAAYSVPRPQWLPVLVVDNGLRKEGILHATGTTLTVYPNAGLNSWTTSGTRTLYSAVLTYRLP